MAALPLVFMIASAAASAYGAVSTANAQKASYKSQQNAANYNATVNRDNASSAEAAASANELAMRRTNDQRMGAIRAQIGSTGGGYTGTNLELADQDASNAELDALDTRYKGKLQATGLLASSNLDEYQGQVAGANATTAGNSAWIGGAASALGSASNYYNYRSLSAGGGGT